VLDSLPRRPRGRAVSAALHRASGGRLGAPPPPPPAHLLPYPIDLEERSVTPQMSTPGPIVDLFYERLSEDDLARLDEHLRTHPPHIWSEADEPTRRAHAVPFALWLELPGVEERLGLSGAQPPEHIHHMASGPRAAGGGLLQAEQLHAALTEVGAPPGPGDAFLDFGCSSGRVVRVLAAARPDTRWLGCDPNADAVAWANEHLPDIAFFASPLAPPLPELADGELTGAYAISIWSHFDAAPALAWLEEMRRVIRPGGHLIVTTHGIHSVAYYARRDGEYHQRAIFEALYRDGFLYFDVFDPEEGDWGVQSTGWGMAFMTAEWLQARVTPAWSVQLFRPGAVEGNQDLYVLRRET
jgi:SAM-dependent methyltransferase